MSGTERRHHTRTRAHNVVTYLSIGKKRVTAAIDNLSIGGALLRTSVSAAAGTPVGLEFFDGDSKATLSVGATVVAVGALQGLGVKFDRLSFEQHRRISALIEVLEAARPSEPAPPASTPRAEGAEPASAGPGIKRRRNRRVPTKDATAHVRMMGEVVALSVPVSNVSMGGLFLQTSQKLRVGAPIDVELTLGKQSMVISGQIVGEAPGQFGLAPGVSMSFGPMPRRTAERLRQALATLAPLAAGGLAQEVPPAGYTFEAPPAPAPAPAPSPPRGPAASLHRGDFDFGAGDLAGDAGEAGEALQAEELRAELERLKAEVRLRQERIALLEQTLAALPK